MMSAPIALTLMERLRLKKRKAKTGPGMAADDALPTSSQDDAPLFGEPSVDTDGFLTSNSVLGHFCGRARAASADRSSSDDVCACREIPKGVFAVQNDTKSFRRIALVCRLCRRQCHPPCHLYWMPRTQRTADEVVRAAQGFTCIPCRALFADLSHLPVAQCKYVVTNPRQDAAFSREITDIERPASAASPADGDLCVTVRYLQVATVRPDTDAQMFDAKYEAVHFPSQSGAKVEITDSKDKVVLSYGKNPFQQVKPPSAPINAPIPAGAKFDLTATFSRHCPDTVQKLRKWPMSALVVMVTKRTALADLLKPIQDHHTIPAHICRQKMVGLLGAHSANDDDDCVCDSTDGALSLKCPISQMRMEMPARGFRCRHLDCFDFVSYLHAMVLSTGLKPKKRNTCPICSCPMPIWEVYIDGYVTDILAALPEDETTAHQVMFRPSDASWYLPTANANAQPASVNVAAMAQQPGPSPVPVHLSPSPEKDGGDRDPSVIDLTKGMMTPCPKRNGQAAKARRLR
ncbi:unnamed protein product [Vitrella brassicaformis CCMP3155]|uniref:SP-RING-type domain-containing protein n=1 Tax=Vitrella brassicaformis (strain CCMP3155) TaxID=1169540 RepID=A0A0G4EK61_VITBC|nr:unnamed protein product [Vitrella brassicaformis CCMP3155]|eukprot:CEL97830.1 unnamed protein product [Vitrella brassicaformis CCMP3155]